MPPPPHPDAGAVSQAASAWAAYGGRDEGGVGDSGVGGGGALLILSFKHNRANNHPKAVA